MNAKLLDTLFAANSSVDAAGLLALANADPRTVTPIAGSNGQIWMAQGGRYARLQRTAAAIAANDQASADQLLSIVSYCMNGANFDTTEMGYAQQTAALGAVLVALNAQSKGLYGLSSDEVLSLVALGGGYQVFDATQDDCQAAIVRASYSTLSGLVDAEYLAANTLRNNRITKMEALKAAGTAAPATLADLDKVT